MGILLVTLVAFSGFASAATISNTGSNIHYLSNSDRYVNNWYITTTNSSSSTFIFRGINQKHTSTGWHTIANTLITVTFSKVNSKTTRMTSRIYVNGKVASYDTSTAITKMTPLNYAKSAESYELKSLKTTL